MNGKQDMQLRPHTAQTEPDGTTDSLTEGTVEESFSVPVFDGPASAKWVMVGAFIIIFVLVMMAIIRGRVVKPAQRKANRAGSYFEPAGEDAEISFDDAPPVSRAEPVITDHDDDDIPETLQPVEIENPKRKGPFAGLFGKRQSSHRLEPDENDSLHLSAANDRSDNDDLFDADPQTLVDAPSEGSKESLMRVIEDDVERRRRLEAERDRDRQAAAAALARERAADAERRVADQRLAEERRRAEEAEYAHQEEQRRTEVARAVAAKQQQQSNFDQAGHSLALIEQNIAATSSSLRADMNQLQDRLGASLDQRFAAFSQELNARLHETTAKPEITHTDDTPYISEAYFSEFADLISEQMSSLRETVSTAFARLENHILAVKTDASGTIGGAKELGPLGQKLDQVTALLSERYAGGASAPVQLRDLLADALPPNRYALKYKLSNGRSADALVEMPKNQPPLAIDAGFPIDAFEDYRINRDQAGQSVATETEFRRLVLRHIVDLAEQIIIDGETADCAIMFVPSESVFAQIHAEFPDLVQESYRARVWMAGPTSLMATLHTVSAVLNTPRDSSGANEAIMSELYALRQRVGALEKTWRKTPERYTADGAIDVVSSRDDGHRGDDFTGEQAPHTTLNIVDDEAAPTHPNPYRDQMRATQTQLRGEYDEVNFGTDIDHDESGTRQGNPLSQLGSSGNT